MRRQVPLGMHFTATCRSTLPPRILPPRCTCSSYFPYCHALLLLQALLSTSTATDKSRRTSALLSAPLHCVCLAFLPSLHTCSLAHAHARPQQNAHTHCFRWPPTFRRRRAMLWSSAVVNQVSFLYAFVFSAPIRRNIVIFIFYLVPCECSTNEAGSLLPFSFIFYFIVFFYRF
jgi:hypothetical protein